MLYTLPISYLLVRCALPPRILFFYILLVMARRTTAPTCGKNHPSQLHFFFGQYRCLHCFASSIQPVYSVSCLHQPLFVCAMLQFFMSNVLLPFFPFPFCLVHRLLSSVSSIRCSHHLPPYPFFPHTFSSPRTLSFPGLTSSPSSDRHTSPASAQWAFYFPRSYYHQEYSYASHVFLHRRGWLISIDQSTLYPLSRSLFASLSTYGLI